MAQYIEGSDRYQPMLLPAAVDDYVSSASPVRAIDAFVDSLDLPALGFKTRNDSSEGRSSYHPGSLLKLYLWGYLKRTRSSRGLENACAENLQAIWLTGNLRSDHSTISDFRKNHSAALKGILRGKSPNQAAWEPMSAPVPRQKSSQRPAPWKTGIRNQNQANPTRFC